MNNINVEEIRQRFEEAQSERRQKNSASFLSRVLRKLRIPEIPPLRPLNDYGDREVGVGSGSVDGIGRIVKVMHDHRTGRLPGGPGEEQ